MSESVSGELVIADSCPVLREGLKTIVRDNTDLRVCGATGSGIELIELVRQTRPDMLITELDLGGINGFEVIREIAGRARSVRILIYTTHERREIIARAIWLGAHGYAIKNGTIEELLEGIKIVCRGTRYIPQKLIAEVAEALFELKEEKLRGALTGLTSRERQVIALIVEGNNSRQIAKSLCISHATVRTHRQNVMEKLGLHSVVETIKYAYRHNIGFISLLNPSDIDNEINN